MIEWLGISGLEYFVCLMLVIIAWSTAKGLDKITETLNRTNEMLYVQDQHFQDINNNIHMLRETLDQTNNEVEGIGVCVFELQKRYAPDE